MEFRNLDINIVYQMCEELTRKNRCGPLETDFIYRAFSDIPKKKIDSNIRSLVHRGWIQEDKDGLRLFLTDQGRSEIRAFIPAKLLSICEKLNRCKAH